jgi:hypothetical protein
MLLWQGQVPMDAQVQGTVKSFLAVLQFLLMSIIEVRLIRVSLGVLEELLFLIQVVVETEATPVKWREGVYDITAKKGQLSSARAEVKLCPQGKAF